MDIIIFINRKICLNQYSVKGDYMKQCADIFISLICKLNTLSGKKRLKKISIKHYINKYKMNIKKVLKKNSYTPYDIYEFLLFIETANASGFFSNITNIDYFCNKNADTTISTGYLKINIDYETNNNLYICYKPIIYENMPKLDMEWIISDNNTSIINYTPISGSSKAYSKTINELRSKTNNNTYTDILEQSSYDILCNIIIICIENIFSNIEMRYLYEK